MFVAAVDMRVRQPTAGLTFALAMVTR